MWKYACKNLYRKIIRCKQTVIADMLLNSLSRRSFPSLSRLYSSVSKRKNIQLLRPSVLRSPSSCQSHLTKNRSIPQPGSAQHCGEITDERPHPLVQRASFFFSPALTRPISGFSRVVKEILITRLRGPCFLTTLRVLPMAQWGSAKTRGPTASDCPGTGAKPNTLNFPCIVPGSVSQRHGKSTATTAASYLFIFRCQCRSLSSKPHMLAIPPINVQ